MAELITKPVKKNIKNQSCSTRNLTKLSSLYLNNIKLIKKSDIHSKTINNDTTNINISN
jgi:hypothetical protein